MCMPHVYAPSWRGSARKLARSSFVCESKRIFNGHGISFGCGRCARNTWPVRFTAVTFVWYWVKLPNSCRNFGIKWKLHLNTSASVGRLAAAKLLEPNKQERTTDCVSLTSVVGIISNAVASEFNVHPKSAVWQKNGSSSSESNSARGSKPASWPSIFPIATNSNQNWRYWEENKLWKTLRMLKMFRLKKQAKNSSGKKHHGVCETHQQNGQCAHIHQWIWLYVLYT